MRSVGFALGDKAFLTVLDNIMGNTPTIFTWDLELGNLANHPDCPVLTILGHTGKINRALWGPLNEVIYSGSDDTTLRVTRRPRPPPPPPPRALRAPRAPRRTPHRRPPCRAPDVGLQDLSLIHI